MKFVDFSVGCYASTCFLLFPSGSYCASIYLTKVDFSFGRRANALRCADVTADFCNPVEVSYYVLRPFPCRAPARVFLIQLRPWWGRIPSHCNKETTAGAELVAASIAGLPRLVKDCFTCASAALLLLLLNVVLHSWQTCAMKPTPTFTLHPGRWISGLAFNEAWTVYGAVSKPSNGERNMTT